MSSTRGGKIGAPLNQSRFCSAPEYSDEVNGVVVAKRCKALQCPRLRRLILFLQQRSLQLRGMAHVAEEFRALFSDEIGMPIIKEFAERFGNEKVFSGRELRPILAKVPRRNFKSQYKYCHGFPGCRWIEAAVAGDNERKFTLEDIHEFVMAQAQDRLAKDLLRHCIDPAIREPFDGIWYMLDLVSGLERYRDWVIAQARESVAMTSVSLEVFELLEFAQETESMVLGEGGVRIGKSWSLKAWCGMNPGLARYVECPSTNDDRSFYVAVANALGVASGASYTGAQISARVIEMMREQPLLLVIDEAHYAWPQKNRPTGVPPRILWLKTLHDMGVPIALVATTDFTKWQQLMVQKCGWTDGQFKGRLARYRRLPDLLGAEDLEKVAWHLLPEGSEATVDYLVGFAMTAASGAAAIAQTLKAASYRSKKTGRKTITHEDVEDAVLQDMLPSENELARAMAPNARHQEPRVSGAGKASSLRDSRDGSANHSQPRSEALRP